MTEGQLHKVINMAKKGTGNEKANAERIIRKYCLEKGLNYDTVINERKQGGDPFPFGFSTQNQKSTWSKATGFSTNYFETFNATEDNLKWALDLEADRMVNSYIAKKDLETEMTVVRNEFESGENNPQYRTDCDIR